MYSHIEIYIYMPGGGSVSNYRSYIVMATIRNFVDLHTCMTVTQCKASSGL